MNKNCEKIKCPVCFSYSDFFSKKSVYTIYKCKNCNLKFVWPIPINLQDLYGQSYFNDNNASFGHGYSSYDEDKNSMRSVFVYEINNIEKYIKSESKKILDIGSATGYFLDLAKNNGWETFGSEISKWAGEEASRRGHNIFVGDFLNYTNNFSFQAVTMWDVLEHIKDPNGYIKKINKILEKKGLFLINTVDADSWWARLLGRNWNMIIPPEHLFFFTKKSLSILLKKNGFEILQIKKIGKKFSLPYIFKILFNWTGIKIFEKLSLKFNNKFWRKFDIPINIRDNIFILARKV